MKNLTNPIVFKNMVIDAHYECVSVCGNIYEEVFPFGKVPTGRILKYFVNTPKGVAVAEYIQHGVDTPKLQQMYVLSTSFVEVVDEAIKETMCGKYDTLQYLNNRD